MKMIPVRRYGEVMDIGGLIGSFIEGLGVAINASLVGSELMVETAPRKNFTAS